MSRQAYSLNSKCQYAGLKVLYKSLHIILADENGLINFKHDKNMIKRECVNCVREMAVYFSVSQSP
jgi:hypothetical protein